MAPHLAFLRPIAPRTALLLLLFLGTARNIAGQERLNITAGAGFPEALHAGARVQWPQLQAGLAVGSFPVADYRFLTLSGDVFFHFAGASRFSERRPVYARAGLIYFRDATPPYTDVYGYANLRVGRDLNVSEVLGFTVDAGLVYELFYKVVKDPGGVRDGYLSAVPLLPAVSLGVFYRLP